MAFMLILLICLPIAHALSTAESIAIQDLANALNNPEWDLSSNPCSWAGITCNSNGNITGISIINKNYEGSIPTSIGNLSALTDLELYNNKLTGSIPASIGRLVLLKILSFGTNELSGSIPPEIETLTNLRRLYLDGNQLNDTIPSSIGNLSSLQELSLATNSLTGGIPREIGRLKNLTKLWLHSNQFSGLIPQSLSDLTSLSELMLSYNSFSGNISFLQTMPTLQRLRLNRNNFSGSIPSMYLPNLTECDLGFNHLDGNIPTSLASSKNLETLFLGHNRLQGSIPVAFGDLTSLVRLDVSHNSLNGSTSHISSVSEKDLSFNYFEDLKGVLDLNCDAFSAKQDVCFPSTTGSGGAFRLNAGGPEISFHAETFAADYSTDASTGLHQIGKTSWVLEFSGLQGDTIYSTNAASGGSQEIKSQSGVYATSKWSSNYLAYHGTELTNGNYTVTLYFVDIIAPINGRVFDVLVQRKMVLKDFDIRAIAGTSAYAHTLNASVTNGTLSIEFIGSRYNYYYTNESGPIISAISVIPTNPSRKKSSRWIIIGAIAVGLMAFLLLALAACLILVRQRRRSTADNGSLTELTTTSTMDKFSKIGPTIYSYQQLLVATCSFDEKFLLGRGGYGAVYKGTLPNGNLVAVKQLTRKNNKSMQTFKKEIAILSMLQHRNLVGINGYCLESENSLLVCEYMENGSLDNALFKGPGLDWQTRMRIAIGAACGLQYLHEESKYHVIHCDVKLQIFYWTKI